MSLAYYNEIDPYAAEAAQAFVECYLDGTDNSI